MWCRRKNPEVDTRIAALDSSTNVAVFFDKYSVEGLTDRQLRNLLIKLAGLDGKYQLSSFVLIVKSEMESRDISVKFKVTTAIAFLALIVSIYALYGPERKIEIQRIECVPAASNK